MADAKATGAALKEKIDAEAEAAEAESPEEPQVDNDPHQTEGDDGNEEAAEETPVPEPEPEARSQDPKKAFDRAFKAFGEKLLRIFEVDELTPAPHPGVVGFMLPGFAEPRTHDNFTTCSTCNGLGKVLTGANTGDQSKDLHVCPDTRCKGNGFWQKATAVQAAPQTGPLAQPPVTPENGEYAEAPAWMGDPNLTPTA